MLVGTHNGAAMVRNQKVPQKKLNIELPYDSETSLPSKYSKEVESITQTNICLLTTAKR
jgi:hypothetical protein